MKLDDFSQLKTIKSKQDAELVFEKYFSAWKEENPDVTEKAEETAREDFETEYNLNNENDKVKSRAVSRLAKEAAEIRSPLESSYNNAKSRFDAESELKANFPKFISGVEGIASELVPEKIEWYKGKDNDEEVPIEVDLPADDRKEIMDKVVKRLQTPDSYELFRAGKMDELKERVSEYVDYLVGKKTKEVGAAKIAEIFLGRGVAKGSNVGATNSFATQQSKANAHEKTEASRTEKEGAVLQQFGDKKS